MALNLALCLCVYLLFTKGAEGSIDDVDCVEIYKQPAFQHPSLKNHKIQEIFSSYEDLERSDNYEKKEQCPKGTVPIFRQRNGSESFHLNTTEYLGQHVHPRLYGDSVTPFTNIGLSNFGDGFGKTGCYNTQCPGFAVLSRNHRIGNQFLGSSVYGKTSHCFTLQIFQDVSSGNWILKLDNEVICYWPKELFTELNKGASIVRYGGNTFMSSNGKWTLSSSRFFRDGTFLKCLIIDSNYIRVYSIEYRKLRCYADVYDCFEVTYWGYGRSSGDSFSFGGPGGKCGV
ncbi:unnamed protein product [Brassica oleracea]